MSIMPPPPPPPAKLIPSAKPSTMDNDFLQPDVTMPDPSCWDPILRELESKFLRVPGLEEKLGDAVYDEILVALYRSFLHGRELELTKCVQTLVDRSPKQPNPN